MRKLNRRHAMDYAFLVLEILAIFAILVLIYFCS